MTNLNDLPIDDHASLSKPFAQTGGVFSGFTEVTWAMITTGFLLGILIGSIFIVGREASPSPGENPSFSSSLAAPAIVAKESTSTAAEFPEELELAAEREKLTREIEAERLRREVASLRNELAGLSSTTVTDEPVTNPTPPLATAPRTTTHPVAVDSQGAVTLSHWNQLNAIILQEAAMRAAPSGGVDASNAGGFLEARRQAAEFAALSIRSLEIDGVDSSVIAISEKLALWYDDGRKVAEQGVHLLTRASNEERQGPLGSAYQAAERSHSTQVNAINSDGERVRQEMTRKYRLSFPPLN